MLTSVMGVYRNGQVELVENPSNILEGTRVVVTFMRVTEIDLASQEIDREQAGVLRASLATFVEDWDSPDMSIYDDYDAAKANR